jgi:hypothetical protein
MHPTGEISPNLVTLHFNNANKHRQDFPVKSLFAKVPIWSHLISYFFVDGFSSKSPSHELSRVIRLGWIFSYWAIALFGQFFENYRRITYFWTTYALFSTVEIWH